MLRKTHKCSNIVPADMAYLSKLKNLSNEQPAQIIPEAEFQMQRSENELYFNASNIFIAQKSYSFNEVGPKKASKCT